jgi:hypothetical protein
MGPSQVIGGTETDPSHDIKTSLGFVGFSPAPGLEISCNPGRSLVLFLESKRTNRLPDQEDPPTVQRQTISSPKTMLTVAWNPHGFHLVSLLSKRQK